MRYPPEAIPRLIEQQISTCAKLQRTALVGNQFASGLTNADGKKFFVNGVVRRLMLISRCIEKVFEIFPPSQTRPLDRETLEDLQIYLHGLIIHCSGVDDNLAWSYVSEYGLQLNRHDVSLFRQQLQRRLPTAISNYVDKPEIGEWHRQYSVDYRDALAHRIPLYVPPSQITPADADLLTRLQIDFQGALAASRWLEAVDIQSKISSVGTACPYFVHEFARTPMIIHPQVVCDGLTMVELCETVMAGWAPPLA